MVLRIGGALWGALFLSGCAAPYSPAPPGADFPAAAQAKLQAASHWNAISAHIEKQLLPALQKSPNLPLYVDTPQASAFNQAMAKQLITSLVNDGYVVSKTAHAALRVDIDTQVLEFSARRPQYTGQRSTLVDGAWTISGSQATQADTDTFSWFHAVFGSGETPKTEIVVTISISDERRYYARTSAVYYVTDSDRQLYQVAPPAPDPHLMKSFTVKGG
ncbi:hypothetical protein AAKU55_002152 [Oxalobacteraceae bacterium GrIS 1.11]